MSVRATVILDGREERILKRAMEVSGDNQSTVIRNALHALEQQELAEAYAKAFESWGESEDEQLWDATVRDGLE